MAGNIVPEIGIMNKRSASYFAHTYTYSVKNFPDDCN